jgi:hypothetical protein
VLFDFFKTLNTGEPENEGDPPVFNQDIDQRIYLTDYLEQK